MEVSIEKKLELISKIHFFDRFDEDDRIVIANMADFRQYNPGENLIRMGHATPNLFFIINGTVDVMLNGKLIVELAGGGHVFGEMSFVYRNPANADVVANQKVTAMILDTAAINAMVEPIYYKLRMEIYRSCAELLAKRLINTNAIAVSDQ